jgi:two-component system, cell cycle response regulator DivK
MSTQKTILVIDDSTTNIVLLHAVLNNKGYEIDTALSVKEAYAVISKRLPQLILLDLLMPRINGFEFLQELKNDNKLKNIPVVVVSALTDSETIKKSMSMGATSFIKKPVDIQYLIETVASILEHQ